MKTNFILVDFENIQPKNMGALRGGAFKIKVFIGASQSKVSLDMAQALQSFGSDAEYIQISGNGSNALDFHIAYYIGRLASEHPQASFTIISKDTGFDPLIRHLKAQHIECRRTIAIADLAQVKAVPGASRALAAEILHAAGVTPARKAPKAAARAAQKPPAKSTPKPAARSAPKPVPKAAPTTAPALPANAAVGEMVNTVLINFSKRGSGLPRTSKTLASSIRALFKPRLLTEAELSSVLQQLVNSGKLKLDNGKVSYFLQA